MTKIKGNAGVAIISTIVVIALGCLASAQARTFTSTDGRSLEATVESVKGETAILKLTNRNSVTVPFDRLIEADREYLKEWAKEDAKNRVPRVEVEVDSNKRDSNVQNGYEERRGSVKFQIDITNQERGFRIEGATATLVVLGDYLYEEDEMVVMQRLEFKDIKVDFGKTYRLSADEIRYEYDKSGYTHGQKYSSYIFILKTAAGKVIDISGSTTRIESLADLILKLKQGEHCNDRYEKIKTSSSGVSTILR